MFRRGDDVLGGEAALPLQLFQRRRRSERVHADAVTVLADVPSVDPFPVRLELGSRKASARWHAEWNVAKRRVSPRATARNAGIFPSRADSPGATTLFPCPDSHWRVPSVDTCPGGTAATDAQWGDRAFERRYRDRMGLRWLVCSRARSTGAPGLARSKFQYGQVQLAISGRSVPCSCA